eukprot:m51a1_g14726 hypothetical protein (73) ;mRNA; f:208057-208362
MMDSWSAAHAGDASRLRAAIAAVPSCATTRDARGLTALHYCCARGHVDCALLLLSHGADPNASPSEPAVTAY